MVAIQEKDQKICFFLANNRSGGPSAQEKDAVLKFRMMLAGAKTYKDLIPFVAEYSRRNVTKRVRKLRTGFNNVLSSRNIKKAIGDIDTKNVFLSLLRECSQLIRPTPNHDSDYRLLQTPTSCAEFVRLVETAKKLEDREEWDWLYVKIRVRYAAGSLIQFATCHKSYEFEWVPDLFQTGRTGEMKIKSRSLEEIARSRVDELLDRQKPQRRIEYDAFVVKAKEKAKEDREKWPSEFVTKIHCEIRIIRKRCCLFCDEWINHFNKVTGYNFTTGGSHGKAYRRAALTGVDDNDWVATDNNLMKAIDKHVVNCIRSNIKTHRAKLEAPSDEYASPVEDWPNFAAENYKIKYTASIGI